MEHIQSGSLFHDLKMEENISVCLDAAGPNTVLRGSLSCLPPLSSQALTPSNLFSFKHGTLKGSLIISATHQVEASVFGNFGFQMTVSEVSIRGGVQGEQIPKSVISPSFEILSQLAVMKWEQKESMETSKILKALPSTSSILKFGGKNETGELVLLTFQAISSPSNANLSPLSPLIFRIWG
jgi:hypothetical protein